MINFIHNSTLKSKLLITYFLLVAGPIILISLFFTNQLTSTARQNSESQAELFVSQFHESSLQRLTTYYELVNVIGKSPSIINMPEMVFKEDYEILKYYTDHIQPIVDIIESRIPNVSIRTFTKKLSIPFSRVTNNVFDDLPVYGFPAMDNLEFPGINWFTTTTLSANKKRALCAFFLLRDNNYFNNPLAVISLFFDESDLYSLISKEKDGNNIVFLLNDKDEIITTTERNLLSEKVPKTITDFLTTSDSSDRTGLFATLKPKTDSTYITFNSNRYILVREPLDQPEINIFDWEIVYLKNVNSFLSFQKSVWIISSIVSLISILISYLIVFIIINNITTRFSSVIHKIENIKSGYYKLPRSPEKKDEFGILEESFDTMLERIDHLVNSVFIGEINRNKLEVEKKEAELIALRNQINPHFLFNTLETVRMNLISINDQENASIVKLIADNFRISLANKKDTYTLKDELRFVDNYVKIQRYRFKDKITFTKKIPTDLLKLPIPELIIQPLIENSFYHGLEKKIENGSVVLEILIENNRVFITVTDDGVGMSESKKNELNNLITNTQTLQVDIRTRRMALRNIYSRLFRMYESELTFAIKSESNVGTEIAISFPIQIGELS